MTISWSLAILTIVLVVLLGVKSLQDMWRKP